MRTVYPQVGYTEADITDLLATRQFVFCDCFTIQPLVGDLLLYTNYQQDVTLVPVYETVTRRTFVSNEVNIAGLRMKSSIGTEVDEQEIQLEYPGGLLYQSYLSWPQALLTGRLDGASIRRDRYVRESHTSPWIGGWTMFKGLVSGIDKVGRSAATVKVKSDLILLDTQMPKDLYEPNCLNTFGDANCGIDLNALAVIATIGASPTRSILPWSGVSASYALGKVHIVGGDAVTRVRTISRVDASNVYLAYPLDFDPNAGDNFTAYPGCDRTMASCLAYHGDPDWKTRFRGYPFIPVAEAAVGVGVGGSTSKGGK